MLTQHADPHSTLPIHEDIEIYDYQVGKTSVSSGPDIIQARWY